MYDFVPDDVYEIKLKSTEGYMKTSYSFKMPRLPFISAYTYNNVQEFYGDIFAVSHSGTINIADFSKVKFIYITGDGLTGEIPVISMDEREIILDMTNAPDGVISLDPKYVGYYEEGKDCDVLTPYSLKVYKVKDDSPVITSTEVQNNRFYAVGLNLNSANSATVKIYKPHDGVMNLVEEANLAKTSNTRMDIPQSAFEGLEDGEYVAFYIINGVEQAIQVVNYMAPEVPKFVVTFKDWNGTILKQYDVPDGTGATAPADPAREGYTFKGWDKEFDKITEDTTVTAQYEINKYDVTFNPNGGTEVEDIKDVPYGSLITEPQAPTKLGYGFYGWYKDEEFTTKWDFVNNKDKSNITLYANWVENTYTVTFVDYDDEVIKTQKVKYGQSAEAPKDPVREGYTFKRWDKEFDNIIEDTTIKAVYKSVYTVTFNSNGGTEIVNVNIVDGETIAQPTPPSMKGYGFDGWYIDEEFTTKWNFTTDKVISDITLYANWIMNTYTVTFTGFNGGVIGTQNIAYGESATAPQAPDVEGYTFKGWDKTFDKITESITVAAVYEINKYTVTFVDHDGKEIGTLKVKHGQAAEAPENPVREGYTFKRWDKEFDNIIEDTTIKAVYEIKKYTVIFVDWNDTVLKTQENIPHGSPALAPAVPVRQGYTFKSWDKAFDIITGNITVKATYTAHKHSIYFHSMGGSSIASMMDIDRDSKITKPEMPIRNGYDFAGWYKDYACTVPWDFEADVVKGNTTLFAKWVAKSYTISVNQNITGGSITANETAKAGETVTINVTPDGNNTLKSLWWSASGAYANDIGTGMMNGTISFVMPAMNIEINATFNQMATVSVSVSKAESPYTVSVYSSSPYFYDYKEVLGGKLDNSFTVPKGGTYAVYASMGENENWHWDYKEVNVTDDITVNFTIPVTYAISGKIDCSNGSLSDLYVYASSMNGYGSAYINTDGTYIITGLASDTYTVTIGDWGNKYSGELSREVTVNDADVQNIDFTIVKGADLRVNVSKVSGTPAFKVYVNLYRQNGQNWDYVNGTYSSGNGIAAFDGTITSEGKYKVEIAYLEGKNYTNPRFVSEPVEFDVTNEDINAGTLSKDMKYADPTDAVAALTGDGNLVVTSVKTVQKGDLITLEIRYKNNGNVEINPAFTITLPEGLNLIGNGTHNVILAPNASGKYKAAISVGGVAGDTANINVDVTLDNITYDFGSADITITKITLNAPMNVKTNESFKVYGEATEGSIVKIKNAITGQILKTVSPQGKFYVAEIKLPEGETKLVAEAMLNNTTAQSGTINILAKSSPIIIRKVIKDNYLELPLNTRLGVHTFSQYVNMDLMGFDFKLATEFENASEITSIVYHFADLDFVAEKSGDSFSATFSGWGGAGLKSITATVVTADNRILDFIIAEVMILIDPSGIVKNSVTGGPLEGALVTCWILNENNNVWEKWDAESYGQINPQYTDANGKYGWMVPTGKYRITAVLGNFKEYDTIFDYNFSDENGTTIIIPPPRDDVNFSMVPETFAINVGEVGEGGTITVKETAQYTETVTVTVTPNEGKQLKTLKIDGIAIQGTTFTMPAKNIVVTAEFEAKQVVDPEIPDDDNDDNDNDGGDTDNGDIGGIGNGGNTGDKANDGKEENSDTGNGESTPTEENIPKDLKVEADENGKVIIPSDELSGTESIEIKGEVSITFNKEAVESIGIYRDASVSIKKVDNSTLSSANRKLAGDRPVFAFEVKSGEKTVSKIKGEVTLAIPYELSAGEKAEYIRVYYVDDNGITTRVSNCYYDIETASVVFRTDDISNYMYAIGYSEINFNDTKGWAEQYIYYLADRGIISGKGNGTFAPDDSITRAEFVKLLSGVADADLSNYTTYEFADVKASDWFASSVAWANEIGITKGVGGNKFAPNANITREEMAVMIARFADKIGYSLSEISASTTFNDHSDISTFAAEAVARVQKAGIINGKPNNLFDPKGKATRAEGAKVIATLMQNTGR